MSENLNFMEQWFNTQRKMYDSWQDTMTMAMNPKEKVEAKKDTPITNILEESMKTTQELLKKWFEASNEQYTKSMKGFNNSNPQEIISKMLNGANIYQSLNRFWEDLNETMTGQESDPLKFYTRWNEDYMNIVSNNFLSCLPEQTQTFFKNPMDVYKMSTETSRKFLNPWLEGAQNLQNLLSKSMTGDKTAYIEFNKLWNEKFSSTYGKILGMPQFSMNREQMQKQMQSINALINFINPMNEFVATMAKVNQETLEKIIKDYQQMLADGTSPKSYKEFYEYWLKQNEAAYQNLFSTAEFSKLIAQVLDAGVNCKKDFDNLLENQLKFLPFPTRADMDSVYKTLDDLKREVRALKKEVGARKEEKAKEGSKSVATGKQAPKED